MQASALVVLVCFAAALAAPTTEDMKFDPEIEAGCQKIHGITDDELKSARDLKLDNTSENLKGYIKCYMEKSGLIDAEGTFQPDKIKFLSKESVDQCSSKIGKIQTPEQAANMRACLIEIKLQLIANSKN